MKLLLSEIVPANSGRAFVVKKGQKIRVIGRTIVDFVAFNLQDLMERFDQARTKANQEKVFITKGDALWSKRNNVMLTITEDTFREGHHDLQRGMCSRKRYELVLQGEAKSEYSGQDDRKLVRWEELPDHGCWENLSEALKGWNIHPDDIPSPFNIFQDVKIDGETGRMWNTYIRPRSEAYVEMLAHMDCLVVASACSEGKIGFGQPIRIEIYE